MSEGKDWRYPGSPDRSPESALREAGAPWDEWFPGGGAVRALRSLSVKGNCWLLRISRVIIIARTHGGA